MTDSFVLVNRYAIDVEPNSECTVVRSYKRTTVTTQRGPYEFEPENSEICSFWNGQKWLEVRNGTHKISVDAHGMGTHTRIVQNGSQTVSEVGDGDTEKQVDSLDESTGGGGWDDERVKEKTAHEIEDLVYANKLALKKAKKAMEEMRIKEMRTSEGGDGDPGSIQSVRRITVFDSEDDVG
jgi:hypothetical protein